jgi:hypothetical protein
MVISINYQKRKNSELFKILEEKDNLSLSNIQNYIPIYKRFFNLNETNYNSVNLNHSLFISNIKNNNDNDNLYKCKIKNVNNQKIKEKNVFFKLAPLIDPYKFLIGKFVSENYTIFNLPQLNSNDTNIHKRFLDPNNSAYIDGFFLFLTDNLNHSHNFMHGIEYYGSFLAIKNDFKINVFDDLDYLIKSEYFNQNKNVLFKIDDYESYFQDETEKKEPIKIGQQLSIKSNISIKSFDDEIFENIFEKNVIGLDSVKNIQELEDLTHANLLLNNLDNNMTSTLKSNSSSNCSSRTSHTTTQNSEDKCNNCDNCDNFDEENENEEENGEDEEENNDEEDEEDELEDDEEDCEEEKIEVTIPQFPIQLIAMEYCQNTFDDLILNNDLKQEEWFSAFMQIIMILLTYQKAFNFTHNDLHTNNVMYNHTDKKYIYYCYKKKYYKVPTFGRLFKIIDFGRSIYKFDGKLFCSDCFQIGEDAATQYNTEPYFNDKKPRLEPNYSFDLCRLACSIFDYIVDDLDDVKNLDKCDPVKKLIIEWCLDDKGINMLYKTNGTDRYPDFKLYKMIARCVHNHTPQKQLERPEFDAFSNFNDPIPKDVIDIDKIPVYI